MGYITWDKMHDLFRAENKENPNFRPSIENRRFISFSSLLRIIFEINPRTNQSKIGVSARKYSKNWNIAAIRKTLGVWGSTWTVQAEPFCGDFKIVEMKIVFLLMEYIEQIYLILEQRNSNLSGFASLLSVLRARFLLLTGETVIRDDIPAFFQNHFSFWQA